MTTKIKATIFIPTFNGEKYLPEILKSIFSQKFGEPYEVLIIDSGSTDGTLGIIESFIKKYDNLRLHKIPNDEFGHGRTRNLAAQMAKGEFVVYLSHDAIPSHKFWLYEMLKPFELSKNVAGVVGRQIPRRHCQPMLKYEINYVFDELGPPHATTLYYKDNFAKNRVSLDALSYYSDVNSAARRDILLNKVPYQDVQYAEDQLFGKEIISNGYIKAYSARGTVVHSNDVRLREYNKRIFDETFALRNIGILGDDYSNKIMIKKFIKSVLGDSKRIIYDKDYTFRHKLRWLIVNPLFHVQKWKGIRNAYSIDLKDKEMHKKYSLEGSNNIKRQ